MKSQKLIKMGENNTFGIAAGQAAINTASGLVGQTLGRIFGPNDRKNQLKQQAKLNQQAYDINNKMAEANYNREMRKWEETNYSAQKEQMIKAGLNPALLYGMSGGGGATATAAPGSGVSAGQAESARHGMGIEPVSIMQLEIMKAQKENIEADTANKRSENPNIGYTGENIQASTGNIKADTALKQANTEIANLQKTYQNATLDQSIANFHNDAPRIHAQAQSAMVKADVDRATQEKMIQLVDKQLLKIGFENALIQAQTKNTNQSTEALKELRNVYREQADAIAAGVVQGYYGQELGSRQLTEAQTRRMWEQSQNDVPESQKIGYDMFKTILKTVLESQ